MDDDNDDPQDPSPKSHLALKKYNLSRAYVAKAFFLCPNSG